MTREVFTGRIDHRDASGPFDIIGDVHGCADELEELLGELGHRVTWDAKDGERQVTITPAEGRRVVFVGDLVDRGPRTPDVGGTAGTEDMGRAVAAAI